MPNLFDILNYKGEFAKAETENLNEDLRFDLTHNFEVEIANTVEPEVVDFPDGSVYSNTIWKAGWNEEEGTWYLSSTLWSDDGSEKAGDFYTFDSYEKLLGAIREFFKKEDVLDPYKEVIAEDLNEDAEVNVPARTEDYSVQIEALRKMIDIANAIAERFGYDPELVFNDMIRDLRLVSGEPITALLNPNNPIDQLTAQQYNAVKTFFGDNAKNVMLKRLLACDPQECCDQFQQFIDAGHQIPFNNPRQLTAQTESILEDVDDEFFDQSSGFWTWTVQECFLNEKYEDYDPKQGWTEDDIELHKSIDWEARNYKEYDAGDPIKGTIYIYREDGTQQIPNATFHKFIRPNPIYSPYYAPVEQPGMDVVGPMYDGRTHNGYDIHDRYESQAIYDMMSEGFNKFVEDLNTEELDEAKKDEWEVKLIFKDGRTKIGLITNNSEEASKFAKDQYKNNKEVKDFKVFHNGEETPFNGAYYDNNGYYDSNVIDLEEAKEDGKGLPPDLAKAYKNSISSGDVDSSLSHSLLRRGRKQVGLDYGNAHYKEISKEEALRRLKNRDNVESLRLIVPSRWGETGVIQFIDKGGYGDGKYYRPLYQLYYNDNLPQEYAYTNKNGSLVRDSRKIPVQHLVEIALKIYETDEAPVSDEIKQRREQNRVKSAPVTYDIHKSGEYAIDPDSGQPFDGYREPTATLSQYPPELDTGAHDPDDMANYGQLQDYKQIVKKVKTYKKTVAKYEKALKAEEPGTERYNSVKSDLNAYTEEYLKWKRWLKDYNASFRYSVQTALFNVKAKIQKLKQIKDQLRNKRAELLKLKERGLDHWSSFYDTSLDALRQLNKTKRELEAQLETADTGKENILRQIEEIKRQIEAKTVEIANAEGALNTMSDIGEQITAVNKAIATFNDVSKRMTELVQRLKDVNNDIAEKEDEIDVSLADRDAEEINRKIRELDKAIKDLEEQRREIFHKKVDNQANPVDPNSSEFDLFRPINIVPEIDPEVVAELANEAEEPIVGDEEEVEEALNGFFNDPLAETYTEKELKDLEGRVFNQQKIINTYRSTKYDISQLFAHTKCTKCGKEKRVLLSNLINDPDKYGSCKCSNENEEGRARKIVKIYRGRKKLPTNTSGYTGVYHLKTYNGRPYDKWRAVIEIDGEKKFLGDFDTRKEAAEARKKAAKEGIKWYKKHSPFFKEDLEVK